jgi:Domain of unknown function (DUF4412)
MRVLTTLLFSAAAIPAFATDLTIVSKVSRNDAPPQTTTSYISDDHVRMSRGDGKETIFDFKSGQMTTLDSKKKTYYVTTRQDMDAFAARMKEQMNSPEMKKMQEQMKNMPADQQKAMGGMLTVDVRDAGTSRKVAGYTCETWIMTMGQMSTTEECLTNDLQYPAQAWTMYKNFSETMQSAMSAMGPMAKSASSMQEQMKKMKGFPLATTTTVDIMGRKMVSTSEVTEVRKGSVPASAWEVPSGYTKVDNPMLTAMTRSRTRK